MALAEALRRAAVDKPKVCKIGLFVDGLCDDDRNAFDEAVELIRQQRAARGMHYNTGYTASWLLRLVETETGRRLPIQGLQRHISGDCLCGRV
jgi:hypothetical protein